MQTPITHCMYVPLLVYFFAYACSIDVDECESETANCSVNANCTDTFGSFECTCNSGFEGDGFNCTSNFPSQIVFCSQSA